MPKQQTFTVADVQRAKATLAALPRKPKAKPEHLLMNELVKHMRTEIRAALNRGYSLDDIVTALNAQGFDLKTPTLKRYFYASGGTRQTKAAAPKLQPIETPQAKSNENEPPRPGSGARRIVLNPHEEL